jgi:hypothetical protein
MKSPEACRMLMRVLADLIPQIPSLQHIDTGLLDFALSRDAARAVVAAVPDSDHMRYSFASASKKCIQTQRGCALWCWVAWILAAEYISREAESLCAANN